MKIRDFLAAAAAIITIGSASAAAATDYIVGGGSGGDTDAFFLVSTDGKLGLLTFHDITAVEALATPDYGAISGMAQLDNGVLIATPTALFYNFDADPSSHFLLAALLPGDIDTRSASYGAFSLNGEVFSGPGVGEPNDTLSIPNLSGTVQISAAPEPSAWLLMIAGVGVVGLMLRRATKIKGFRLKAAIGG